MEQAQGKPIKPYSRPKAWRKDEKTILGSPIVPPDPGSSINSSLCLNRFKVLFLSLRWILPDGLTSNKLWTWCLCLICYHWEFKKVGKNRLMLKIFLLRLIKQVISLIDEGAETHSLLIHYWWQVNQHYLLRQQMYFRVPVQTAIMKWTVLSVLSPPWLPLK